MGQHRILIVDGEKLIRLALAQKCSEFGYQTLEAENGEEAIRALQNHGVDAILLDVHLPDLSGIQVLEMGAERPGKLLRNSSTDFFSGLVEA